MSEPIDIIEATSDTTTPELAAAISEAWTKETGRRCIILTGFRYAGTVDTRPDTPTRSHIE